MTERQIVAFVEGGWKGAYELADEVASALLGVEANGHQATDEESKAYRETFSRRLIERLSLSKGA